MPIILNIIKNNPNAELQANKKGLTSGLTPETISSIIEEF